MAAFTADSRWNCFAFGLSYVYLVGRRHAPVREKHGVGRTAEPFLKDAEAACPLAWQFVQFISMHIESRGHPDTADRLSAMLKAVSDPSRLRILGLLAERPRTGEELSELVGVRPPTVSHHLKRLAEAGLVTAVAEQYYRVYSLRPDALREVARSLDRRVLARAARPDAGEESFAGKVLRDFLAEGRLKAIPRQRKKRDVVMRQLAQEFEAGGSYNEKEVNETLGRFHEDVATLRREMVGYGLLARLGREYRRAD